MNYKSKFQRVLILSFFLVFVASGHCELSQLPESKMRYPPRWYKDDFLSIESTIYQYQKEKKFNAWKQEAEKIISQFSHDSDMLLYGYIQLSSVYEALSFHSNDSVIQKTYLAHALDAIEKATQYCPDTDDYHDIKCYVITLRRIYLNFNLNNFSKVINLAKEAIATYSKDTSEAAQSTISQSIRYIYRSYRAMHQSDRLEQELIQLQKEYPDSHVAAEALYYSALNAEKNRDYPTAIQRFQQLIVRFPEHPKAKGAKIGIEYINRVKNRNPVTPPCDCLENNLCPKESSCPCGCSK